MSPFRFRFANCEFNQCKKVGFNNVSFELQIFTYKLHENLNIRKSVFYDWHFVLKKKE